MGMCVAVDRVSIAALVLLTVLVITLSLSISVHAVDKDVLWDRFLDLYMRTAILGRRGVDVSNIVGGLKKVLELLESGDITSLEKASELMDEVERNIFFLERNADNMLLMENLRKYSTAGALLLIPLLFYYLFPRLYLALWFRVRRRWVVEE